jgi:hypothetical protein
VILIAGPWAGAGRELGPPGIGEFVSKKLVHTTPTGG